MTAAAFDRVCAARRFVVIPVGSFGKRYEPACKRCELCQGERLNWPEELAVINLEDINMAKLSECEICGTKAELKNTKNFKACGTCSKILSVVDNHSDRIGSVAKVLGKDVELAKALGVPGTLTAPDGVADLEAAVMRARKALSSVLPPEESLDDTQSLFDVGDLAERAAEKITSCSAELHSLRDLLKPEEGETSIRAAERLAKTAAAWAVLMERCRESGFGEFADAEPATLAHQFITAATEPARALDDLKRQLADMLGCPADEIVPAIRMIQGQVQAIRDIVEPETAGEEPASLTEACRVLVKLYHAALDAGETAAGDEELERLRELLREKDGQAQLAREELEALKRGLSFEPTTRRQVDPGDEALLLWAREQLDNGNIYLHVEVREAEA